MINKIFQNDRKPVIIKKLFFSWQCGTEPDFNLQFPGKFFKTAEFFLSDFTKIISVDHYKIGRKTCIANHRIDTFENLFSSNIILLKIHYNPVFCYFIMNIHRVVEFISARYFLKDILIPGNYMSRIIRKRNMNNMFCLE